MAKTDQTISEHDGSVLFGVRLKNIRLRRGLSQDDVAKGACIPASSVSHYESGRRAPSLDVLFRLCLSLNCSADELLGLPCLSEHEAITKIKAAKKIVAKLSKIVR